ncbi:fibronectin type III domain-containing protein 1 isoform X2 [Thalassophryne amazonica]|uniref:fibronectin type III domain-containing protein 1 isoform X2 n=1 Tax=Thalassophryne amazonica TaxID=390379 RepID=UPI001470F86D|nr:fibronectin type III domain-containing protein 1 isoform X2 [Thalassophryne amazonica]
MALGASRTLLALFLTFCAPGCGWAEKSLRPHGGKQSPADKDVKDSWESSIHLDGRPVDRFAISSSRPMRFHRFTKADKDSRSPPLEDVDPEWVNLDGFAVVSGAPVRNTSTGPALLPARKDASVQHATRVNRTADPSRAYRSRAQRRPPQSSSGPRLPEKTSAGAASLDRRRNFHTKPQSDQRNRNMPKLTSESVHVVSLQAQKALGQSAPVNRAVTTKASTPEPQEYEARDISVRVMSPQSVLISWVDPAVEMEKVTPGGSRYYTVRYREKGESARWEYKEGTQRRMMIDSLSADGMYEFSVRISQGQNNGKWSVSVFQRTPESAPSGPPENFEVKPLRGKGTAVTATWDPPEEPNGRIREYILSYAPAMKPFGMKSVTYRSSTTSATIDGLTPGDRYIFKIRATNRRGQGPQSKAFSVVMPGTSSAASSLSKTKESHRTSPAASKQEADLQSTKVTEKLTEAAQPPPANRRVRPLSQTRSYHSIFSSVRGSVRNVVNRGSSSRGRDAEDEEEEEDEKIPTTLPSVLETTTEVVQEKKEPNNDISPEPEDGVDYNQEEDTRTPETPSLKIWTPSPTKPAPSNYNPPPRRPIKIRVHQRPLSKGASSSAISRSSNSSSSSPDSSSFFLPISSSHIQESTSIGKEITASQYPDLKNTYAQPSIEHSKPSISPVKQLQTESPTVTRGFASAVRTNSSSFSNRYGYGRRNPGVLLRGNSTRMLNGYKPGSTSAISSKSNLPSRTPSHVTVNIATSQANSLSGTQNHDASNTFNLSTSKTQGSSTVASTSQSRSQFPSTAYTHGFSRSHNSAMSHNSDTSPELETTHREDNYDSNYKNTEDTDVQEPSSNSKSDTQSTVETRREESSYQKPVVSRTRISPSFAKRFPWLAGRYPGRFGSETRVSSSRQDGRTSSSIGASKPILRGTPSRISEPTGATGVSSIQETREDLMSISTQDTLKNGVGVGLLKPSLTSRNPEISDTLSSAKTSTSIIDSASEPVHRGGPNEKNKDDQELFSEDHKQMNADPTANPQRTADENETVDTKDGANPRPGSSSVITSSHRRPSVGVNGRVRSPFLGNRQFGGSRFPIKPQPAQNSRLGTSMSDSSPSSSSTSFDAFSSSKPLQPIVTSNRNTGSSSTTATKTGDLIGGTSHAASSSSIPSSSSFRDSLRSQGGRSRYPSLRGKQTNGGVKPGSENGKNGRPNLTAPSDKESPSSHGISKSVGQRFITGPDGAKWVIDLEQGLLMNQDGQVLQDSQGQPKRVVLGEDGRTIFDHMGSPLVNQEGLALFGHSRDSRPVVNPKEKVLTVGGKPLVGLDLPHLRTTTTTTTTTTTPPPTTPEPKTTEWTTEESTSPPLYPTCPPGTFSKTDEYGYPVLDPEGILDCYPEDDFVVQTNLPPTTTTTTTETTTDIPTPEPDTRPFNKSPSSVFDLSGKKRFTAPYVNYIQKDPGAPCSLTEALEYLQVDILENLMDKNNMALNHNQLPKNKPHNLTVVAMEGCHSFIILDWDCPLKDDMVSGYMVHSASYDDVLNNRWSSRTSTGTHLAVENLKPNSRYYFKVQAKNVFGLGPISDTLTYVTESDDPLLIERPPGGEPIWIPFSFKYNSAHSACKGGQYVKRTWYRKFVGVVLCNSLRYKIFMGEGLREPFYSIGDTFGQGEDHCQFVDSYRDGRTGPSYQSSLLPTAQGFYRAYRQEPVTFGLIGRRTPHPFVGWYECGVPIPGKW